MKASFIEKARQLIRVSRAPVLSPESVQALLHHSAAKVDSLMRFLVPLAAERAVNPISRYAVGAVGLGTSGAIYLGANWEPSTGPLGDCVHAEQAVVAAAHAKNERGLLKLAVSAAPCGHCRQFLWELSSADSLMIAAGDAESLPLAELLVRPFGPEDLGRHRPLMEHSDWPLSTEVELDELGATAMAAASRSYAPYSASPAGIGLATRQGLIFAGSYIENVAYNPSLSPVLAAIVQAAQLGIGGTDVVSAVLISPYDSTIDHEGWARRLLTTIAPGLSLQVISAQKA